MGALNGVNVGVRHEPARDVAGTADGAFLGTLQSRPPVTASRGEPCSARRKMTQDSEQPIDSRRAPDSPPCGGIVHGKSIEYDAAGWAPSGLDADDAHSTLFTLQGSGLDTRSRTRPGTLVEEVSRSSLINASRPPRLRPSAQPSAYTSLPIFFGAPPTPSSRSRPSCPDRSDTPVSSRCSPSRRACTGGGVRFLYSRPIALRSRQRSENATCRCSTTLRIFARAINSPSRSSNSRCLSSSTSEWLRSPSKKRPHRSESIVGGFAGRNLLLCSSRFLRVFINGSGF